MGLGFAVKVVAVLLVAAFFSMVFSPTFASAREVDRVLASDPEAVLAELESISAPHVPDEIAAEVRGEFWVQIAVGWVFLTTAYVYYKWITDPQWVINTPGASTLLKLD